MKPNLTARFGPGRAGWLIAFVVTAILYGSVYPFAFHATGSITEAFQHFFATWNQPPQSRGDLLANVLLFIPMGLTLAIGLSWRSSSPALVLFCTLCGGLLSFGIEISQYFDAGRVSCMSDFYLNCLGSAVGAAVGSLWRHRLSSLTLELPSGATFVLLLILAWLGWRLFPYAPTIDLHKYWSSLKPIFRTPSVAPFDIFHYAMIWLAFGYLCSRGLQFRASGWMLWAGTGAIFLAKILIVGLVITLPELIGAIMATLVLQFANAGTAATLVWPVTILFAGFILATQLEPWQFALAARPFGWIPFYSLLHGSLGVDIQSFLEKYFLYGTFLWLMLEAGLDLLPALILECALLFSTSVLQTHLPHRSGEITDTLLAVAVAIVYLATTNRASRPRPASNKTES